MLSPVLDVRQESNFIELTMAVLRAHSRLFPDDPYKSPKTLQVIALALTELIPMYWRDARTGERHQLTEPELAAAQFNATTMQLLSVPQRRFEAALDTLQVASLDQARASLTMRQSPRPATGR
jgi:hypothetical protein